MINEKELELYSPDYHYNDIGYANSIEEALTMLQNHQHEYPRHPVENGIPRLLKVRELCHARLVHHHLAHLPSLTHDIFSYSGDGWMKILYRGEDYHRSVALRFRPCKHTYINMSEMKRSDLIAWLCGEQQRAYVNAHWRSKEDGVYATPHDTPCDESILFGPRIRFEAGIKGHVVMRI